MLTIRLRLNEVLQVKHVSQRQLAELTGLRPATIHALCHNQVSRVYLQTLAVICEVLELELSDIMVMQPSG